MGGKERVSWWRGYCAGHCIGYSIVKDRKASCCPFEKAFNVFNISIVVAAEKEATEEEDDDRWREED